MKKAMLASILLRAAVAQTFNVASVRPAAPPSPGSPITSTRGGPGSDDPGQITYTGVTLKTILMAAFSVKSYQIVGPAWLEMERYDISAKIPAGATKEQFNVMLQNLLKERFHLTLHQEPRDLAVYELTIGKNGAKLVPAAAAPAVEPPAGGPGPRADKDGFPDLRAGRMAQAAFMGRDGHRRLAARKQTMAGVTTILESAVDRPIVDKTRLTGEYDFRLDYSQFAPAAGTDAPDLSIFTAVQEQLGLKLDGNKAPIDCWIIDQAERVPTPN